MRFLQRALVILVGYGWPFSTRLRGRIALAFLSLPETDPQILKRKDCAREEWCVESHQAMHLLFPDFLCDVVRFSSIARC